MADVGATPMPALPAGVVPATGLLPRPGEPLWGAPRQERRQPVAALVAIAVVLLLVAAPPAFSSNGLSANPLSLMHDIASSTYDMATMLDDSNAQLAQNEQHVSSLGELDTTLQHIAGTTADLQRSSTQLGGKLHAMQASVSGAGNSLKATQRGLATTSSSLDRVRVDVAGSLANTQRVVTDFQRVDGHIGGLNRSLTAAIGQIGTTVPLTEAFANNTTRVAVAGGDGRTTKVPNLLPGTRVLSVVLPMLQTLQKGGSIPARVDSAQASNPIVGAFLKKSVPPGTNVSAVVLPWDGTYGLPPADWFATHRVNGF